MEKDKKAQHGTMEDYIMKLIKEREARLRDTTNGETEIVIARLMAERNVLYMVLTGWNNPSANPVN